MLASQARGLEFDPQDPQNTLGMVLSAHSPSTSEESKADSWDFLANQPNPLIELQAKESSCL